MNDYLKAQTMTPLQTFHLIAQAEEMAKRNGFKLDIGNDIGIRAYRAPYAAAVTIKIVKGFEEVVTYFEGYEQMKLEQQELDRAKKGMNK